MRYWFPRESPAAGYIEQRPRHRRSLKRAFISRDIMNNERRDVLLSRRRDEETTRVLASNESSSSL